MSILELTDLVSLLRLGLVVTLATLATVLVRVAANHAARQLERFIHDPEVLERARTIVHFTRGALAVLILTVTVLTVLQALGIAISPLLTGVGLLGLTVSLGAQTLIKDYVGGLLILMENQYAIGDVVKVAGVQGEVDRITLRATHLRDEDGAYHIIPNGDIRLVSNLTMEWARALVEVGIEPQADMAAVVQTLEKAMRRARVDDAVRPRLLDTPQVEGWTGFKNGAVLVRLTAKTKPGKQWEVAMALRRYAVEALQAEGIQVALPG
jgi:small conductance mechanosensitive channel